MVYLIGVLGFIGGFIAGQMILYLHLKNVSKEELLTSQKLKWTYGLFNWLMAAVGSYSFILLYQLYFG